jgi:hypothetical protein
MFTVEFEKDSTVITTLDQQDKYEDVEVILADDGSVYMRQYEETLDEYQVLYMSYQQLLDIFASMQQTEGAYYAITENRYD